MMTKWPKRVVLACVIVLAFIGVQKCLTANTPFDDRLFDSALWKSATHKFERDNPRGQMYDDLRHHYLKKGLDKQAVLNLLGPPDIKSDDSLFNYNLGMWSGFRIDYDTLNIAFNSKGKVARVYRVQH